MIRWTGLAPWEFEFPFPDSLASTLLVGFTCRWKVGEGVDDGRGASPLYLSTIMISIMIILNNKPYANDFFLSPKSSNFQDFVGVYMKMKT
jgi:hypothetical protein